jgi:membrane fusion protein (multidrug efflux system)
MTVVNEEAERSPSSVFRPEAIEHHIGALQDGQVLRLPTTWARLAFWLLLLVLVVSLAYASLGTLYEYASGPAVVHIEDRATLTATIAGTVAKVLVQPGQHVTAGQPLVQFVADQESAELSRIAKEFDLNLSRLLRDTTDQTARQSLASLRAQRELAASRLEQRLLRASRAGIVSDLRIRAGQYIGVGELVLSIMSDRAPASLLAVLPGRYRPQLRPGMSLRFELDGYRYQYIVLDIESVADNVVGPSEVKRFLGADVADTVPLDGPLVLVRARLPGSGFVSEGKRYDYYDGLPGRAEVRVRSETILVSLVPALKVFSHAR